MVDTWAAARGTTSTCTSSTWNIFSRQRTDAFKVGQNGYKPYPDELHFVHDFFKDFLWNYQFDE